MMNTLDPRPAAVVRINDCTVTQGGRTFHFGPGAVEEVAPVGHTPVPTITAFPELAFADLADDDGPAPSGPEPLNRRDRLALKAKIRRLARRRDALIRHRDRAMKEAR